MSLFIIVVSNALANTMSASQATAIFAFPLAADMLKYFESFSHRVSWEAIYLASTAVIGCLIFYAARLLKQRQGKLPSNLLFNISSILETTWFIISGLVVYFAHFSTLPKAIAVAYIIYSIFGWLYGFYLLKDQDLDLTTTKAIDIHMPVKYMDYSLAFSLVITFCALGFLTYLYLSEAFYL